MHKHAAPNHTEAYSAHDGMYAYLQYRLVADFCSKSQLCSERLHTQCVTGQMALAHVLMCCTCSLN